MYEDAEGGFAFCGGLLGPDHVTQVVEDPDYGFRCYAEVSNQFMGVEPGLMQDVAVTQFGENFVVSYS